MGLEDAKNQVDQAFTRDDLKGPSFENAFGGATSFLRRRYTKDLRGVDIAVTGSQKGLMVPPGLSFVFVTLFAPKGIGGLFDLLADRRHPDRHGADLGPDKGSLQEREATE